MLNDLDPRFLLSVVMRRFPVFLLTAVVIFTGFAAMAVLLPATYTSSAKILVESQQIPTSMVQSTVGSEAGERLRVIQQRLTTRENMLDIAAAFDVFRDRRDLSPSEIVDEMRRSTSFVQLQLGSSGRGAAATSLVFTVGFSASDPGIAARVAGEYVTRILEDNLKLRTSRAADTFQFFEQEAQRLSSEISAVEDEIVDFKRSHRNTLPETLEYRTNNLTRIQQRQQLLDRDRSNLEEKRELLVELKSRPEMLAAAEETLSDAEKTRAQLETQRRMRLALLSEEHPEILALNTRIAALDRIIAAEAGERSEETDAKVSATISEEMFRIDKEIELIDRNLAQINDELAVLERQEAELDRSIAETPTTTMALTGLTRNYENLQQQYAVARDKLALSATGEQLELKQQAERFEVIEQATVPETPDKPDRMMIIMMGFGGGAGAGLGLVFLLEMLNRAIRRPSDIIAAINVQPLAVIPYIFTDDELRRRNRVKWNLILGLVAGVISVAVLTHIFLLPLDLLASRVLEKTKIDMVLELVRSRLNL